MNDLDLQTFDLIYAGGAVKRFHTKQTIQTQNNAAHQWGVAHIVNSVYPEASKDLIIAAIYHDSHEIRTGDIPAPIKEKSPVMQEAVEILEEEINTTYNFMPKLNKEEEAVLKAADYFELYLFAIQEINMGNKSLQHIRTQFEVDMYYLDDLPSHVRNNINELMENVTK